ncbi:hypothetical protein KZZ52_30975 [Dactylosporangium sp. AC04546]|uniref:hypothetical protein n=1 Tax=Dactylosporangium sp. AC04546 TaxID=2862460 RepID=UPI001EDFDDF8|nr:hypothetical protein [Dactylosporangium sp. AC04546]WVK78417.1 hypothetical protein KZZ52_30975 [Dactylosporangium sp. AC04546]
MHGIGWTPARDQGDGYAVRLDWADARSGRVFHDFTRFTPSLLRAERRAASARRFWAPGPVRPLAVTVVPIDRLAYLEHDRECFDATCPTTAPLLGLTASDAETTAGHPHS